MSKKIDFARANEQALATISIWCPGWIDCKRANGERKLRSPLREDKNIGSFSIREDTGQWFDFATNEGGDAVGLYARIKKIRPGQAAAEILGFDYYEDAEEEYAFFIDPELRANVAAGINDPTLRAEYLKITEPALPKSSWPLVRYGDMTIEPPRWLIKGILEDDSLALIFGASGQGKSYVALDMAVCIATGETYHSRQTRTQGAVIYVAGEGYKGISKRLRALEIDRKIDLSQAPLYISKKACALRDPELMQHVRSEIANVAATGQRIALIVIDTWARNMDGNENDTQETGEAIRALDNLRAAYECTALIIHHSGQAESERGRGSSALRAALDVEYKVEIKNDILLLKNTKMKDGEAPGILTFAFESVDLHTPDEDGDPTISAVLHEINIDGIVPGVKRRRGVVQTKILDTLKLSGGVMDKATLKASIPDIQERSFYAALKKMVADGDLTEKDGIYYIRETIL